MLRQVMRTKFVFMCILGMGVGHNALAEVCHPTDIFEVRHRGAAGQQVTNFRVSFDALSLTAESLSGAERVADHIGKDRVVDIRRTAGGVWCPDNAPTTTLLASNPPKGSPHDYPTPWVCAWPDGSVQPCGGPGEGGVYHPIQKTPECTSSTSAGITTIACEDTRGVILHEERKVLVARNEAKTKGQVASRMAALNYIVNHPSQADQLIVAPNTPLDESLYVLTPSDYDTILAELQAVTQNGMDLAL